MARLAVRKPRCRRCLTRDNLYRMGISEPKWADVSSARRRADGLINGPESWLPTVTSRSNLLDRPKHHDEALSVAEEFSEQPLKRCADTHERIALPFECSARLKEAVERKQVPVTALDVIEVQVGGTMPKPAKRIGRSSRKILVRSGPSPRGSYLKADIELARSAKHRPKQANVRIHHT